MSKLQFWSLVVYITFLALMPRRMQRAIRGLVASLVMFQWRKFGMLSAVLYSVLVENGDGVESLERYLGDRKDKP